MKYKIIHSFLLDMQIRRLTYEYIVWFYKMQMLPLSIHQIRILISNEIFQKMFSLEDE